MSLRKSFVGGVTHSVFSAKELAQRDFLKVILNEMNSRKWTILDNIGFLVMALPAQCSCKVIFRYINTRLCSKAGHLNKALSKGAKTTTWIWNLHDYAHDFDIQQSSTGLIARKVFSSNLAHLSLVFFWISGMHLHGAYLSNYDIWLKDPKSITPSSHIAYSLIGQDILNSYTSQYFSGITITSGFFQLYRSEGIITQSQLKYACATSLIATLICLSGSYLHMQLMSKLTSFYKKFQSLSQDHLIIIFGSSSMSLSAHQIHKMLPAWQLGY